VTRKAIKVNGKGVKKIAVESGVSQPILHRFAKGERDLTLETVDRLARHFDLELKPKGDHDS
jgi:plasmid maintenance system antidote protein VapI